jgi:hypothetical protein
MKKLIFIFAWICIVFIFQTGVNAQNVIAVEHSGVSAFYQNLDTAMAHAVSGDMVYLPASSYNIGTTFKIAKGVHLVGAGSNADSSVATGITLFTGNVYITTGADNGSMEGIYINGEVRFGTNGSDQTVDMYSIKRCCVISTIFLSYDGVTSTASTNLNITECIIKGTINGGYAQNVEVSKCIIEGYINYFNGNTVISNNILLRAPGCCDYVSAAVSATTFKNNIFFAGQNLLTGGTGNSYTHNLFINGNIIPGGNTDNGNFFSVPHDSIFVSQTGNTYNIAHNYHLRPSCIGKNSGTDGTDIGIYGTTTPKKDGEIPFNPHIQTKAIPSSTNSQGNLNINIKVKAQEN